MSKRTTYPWWYTFLKWGAPLIVAGITATYLCLLITGLLAVPSSVAMLKWLPAIYAGLEGLSSVGMLLGSMVLSAAVTGLSTFFFMRGVVLFGVNEEIAVNRQDEVSSLRREKEVLSEVHRKKCTEYEAAIHDIEGKREELLIKYTLLQSEIRHPAEHDHNSDDNKNSQAERQQQAPKSRGKDSPTNSPKASPKPQPKPAPSANNGSTKEKLRK